MAFLDDIIELKMQESRLARSFNVVSPSHDKLRRRSLVEAVKSASGVALIAEAKRASPTEGRIADYDIVEAAKTFEVHGVSAVSVLTDHKYFGGSIEDLDQASQIDCGLTSSKSSQGGPQCLATGSEYPATCRSVLGRLTRL